MLHLTIGLRVSKVISGSMTMKHLFLWHILALIGSIGKSFVQTWQKFMQIYKKVDIYVTLLSTFHQQNIDKNENKWFVFYQCRQYTSKTQCDNGQVNVTFLIEPDITLLR